MSARSFTLNKERQGIITVLNNGNAVKLHDTVICEVVEWNKIKLNTNGWETSTTKRAMNRYFDLLRLPIAVCQERFKWYVYVNGQKLAYTDNMIVEVVR